MKVIGVQRLAILIILASALFLIAVLAVRASQTQGSQPEITFDIDFPSQIRADGEQIQSFVFFKDLDKDITQINFKVTKPQNTESLSFDPQVKGKLSGVIKFTIAATSPPLELEICVGGAASCKKIHITDSISETIVFAVTLLDEGGNESAPKQFAFKVARANVEPKLEITPTSLSFVMQEGGNNPKAQTLQITNKGNGKLAWAVATEQPWIILEPKQGSTPTRVKVSIDATDLQAGEYKGSITVVTQATPTITTSVRVTLSINPAPAVFKLLDLSIKPSTPLVSDPTVVKALIKNTGGESGTQVVELYIDGMYEGHRNVTLASEAVERVSFNHTFVKEGEHTITIRTPDCGRTLSLTVRHKPLQSVFRINEDDNRLWDVTKYFEGKGHINSLNPFYNRELTLTISDDEKTVNHKITPSSADFLKLIGETTVDLRGNSVQLEANGFFQVAKAVFRLDRGERELELRTWDNKLIRSEVLPLVVRKIGKLSICSFAFDIISSAALETILVDIVMDDNNKLMAVTTTNLFNYRKVFSVTTFIKSLGSSGPLHIPPHIVISSPLSGGIVNERLNFEVFTFDLDGSLEKFEIDWGDGDIDTIADPPAGKFFIHHRYTKPGNFSVTLTGYDDEGQSSSFSFELTVVREREKKEGPTSSSMATDGSQQTSGGTFGFCSVE